MSDVAAEPIGGALARLAVAGSGDGSWAAAPPVARARIASRMAPASAERGAEDGRDAMAIPL
jgi:hypothetical protein